MPYRQPTLDLWRRHEFVGNLSARCLAAGLQQADVDLLAWMAEHDQRHDEVSRDCMSTRAWGAKIGRDKNTAAKAAERLMAAGVARAEKTPAGLWIEVHWAAVWDLTPRRAATPPGHAEEVEPAPMTDDRSPVTDHRSPITDHPSHAGVVRPGETLVRAPRALIGKISKPRANVNRVPCAARGRGEALTRVSPGSPAIVRGADGTAWQLRRARPWARDDGYTPDEFLAAVRDRDQDVLLDLYWAGVGLRWWGDCEAFRQRFLACCCEAASRAQSSSIGLLHGWVRANMRDRSNDTAEQAKRYVITGDADDWAARTRAYWRRPAEYRQRQREPVGRREAEVWR